MVVFADTESSEVRLESRIKIEYDGSMKGIKESRFRPRVNIYIHVITLSWYIRAIAKKFQVQP